mmetsp:Transcript_17661/g.50458  ORF Transcript_17661/g.50458 Transcript_17661/m.50458 type:complete len:213 (+) Transcript_17661:2801-3439(+)
MPVGTPASSSPRGSRPFATIELGPAWAAFVRSSALEGGSVAPTRLGTGKGELRPTKLPQTRPFDRPVFHLPKSFLALVARPGRPPSSNLEPRSRRRKNFYEHRRCHAPRGTYEYKPHTRPYRRPNRTSRSCTSAVPRTRHSSTRTCTSSGPLVAAPPPLLGQVGSVLLALTRGRAGSRHRELQLVPTLWHSQAFYRTAPSVARHQRLHYHRS